MLGFTPDEVRAMSLAEAGLAIEGFTEMRRAEAGQSAAVDPPTLDEVRELMELYPD